MKARWAWLILALLAGLVVRAERETTGARPAVIGYLFPQDRLLDPARTALNRSLVGVAHRRVPDVLRARLGPEAGMVGAADLAREAQARR